jgi:hypothetical protein
MGKHETDVPSCQRARVDVVVVVVGGVAASAKEMA